MTYRVLVTGAGGPAAISFIRAIADPDIELLAADIDRWAAGLYLVPDDCRCLLPPGTAGNFVDDLLMVCRHFRINVLVPTVDVELLPIARSPEAFEAIGVSVLSEPETTLTRCLDKWTMYQLLRRNIPMARTAIIDDNFDRNAFPRVFIVKPRVGSGSRGVRLIKSAFDFISVPRDGSFIAQCVLPGDEYSVDVVYDGSSYSAVPRSRVKIDSGVAVAGCTVYDRELMELACAAAGAVGITHVANVQFKRDGQGRPRLLEINPRFSGTMPLTVAAGVNMPMIALRRRLGFQVKSPSYFRELAMVRSFHETFIEPSSIEKTNGVHNVVAIS